MQPWVLFMCWCMPPLYFHFFATFCTLPWNLIQAISGLLLHVVMTLLGWVTIRLFFEIDGLTWIGLDWTVMIAAMRSLKIFSNMINNLTLSIRRTSRPISIMRLKEISPIMLEFRIFHSRPWICKTIRRILSVLPRVQLNNVLWTCKLVHQPNLLMITACTTVDLSRNLTIVMSNL